METSQNKEKIITERMLGILDVCKITGLSKTCITDQIHSGKLTGILVARRFLIPGIELQKYMESSEYAWTKNKSRCYKKSIGKGVHEDE